MKMEKAGEDYLTGFTEVAATGFEPVTSRL